MEPVSIYVTPDYSKDALDKAMEGHFSTLGLEQLIRPGMKVTLKVNLLMRRNPDGATTTHPSVVGAVARRLKALGVTDITVADSPGGPYTTGALTGIYATAGMTEMAREEGVSLNMGTGWAESLYPQGESCRVFNIIDPVGKADLVINLPKLKTHAMTQLSGGVKNLFGCIPGLQKPELHFQFPDKTKFTGMLVDLAEMVSPAVTIVDGVVAMEGDGPSSGTPRQVGLTLACKSPFPLDLALCRLLGMEPEEVLTVAASIRRGLAPARFEELELVGEPQAFIPIPDYQKPSSRSLDFSDNIPSILRRPIAFLRDRVLAPRPDIHREDCIGCGKCAESCPAKVITIQDRKARIAYKNCIHCFCCHEMCPVKAIGIRKAGIMKR